jgi:hypothetical protein
VGKPDQPRGDDGKWIPRGGLGLAVTLAATLAIAFGGSGVTGSAGGSGAGARAGSSSSSAKARDRDSGRVIARLERQGLRVKRIAESEDGSCAANSFGQVHTFFREKPCSALFRGLFEVRDGKRAVAVVAVAWVDMPDIGQAQEFKQLVDMHGTGNITELSTRSSRSVTFTGEHYVSSRDDETVVNAQTEPVGRTAAAVRLADLVANRVTAD